VAASCELTRAPTSGRAPAKARNVPASSSRIRPACSRPRRSCQTVTTAATQPLTRIAVVCQLELIASLQDADGQARRGWGDVQDVGPVVAAAAADPDHVGLRRAGLADHEQQPGQDHSQRVPAQPTAPGGAGGAALQPPTTGDGRQGAHGATWKAAWARTRGSNGAWSTGVAGTRTWKWECPAPMRPRSFSNSWSSPGLIGYHEVPTHDPHPQQRLSAGA
jgi:hypothetical protein